MGIINGLISVIEHWDCVENRKIGIPKRSEKDK